ncbi:helix-turn-helix domain-containing protein [Paenibacillus sp. MBLB4367]|uniref:helix-turn-helix domain-containing protein n=1 Tax=Paenibacillus sp. MBLB4367 TaxID=3384767 RepID=UPI003907EE71
MNILQAVGERIRDIRKQNGYSQEKLGEIGGFHFSYIGQVERGEKNISLLNLAKIAQALGINLHELFAFQSKEAELDSNLIDIMQMLQDKNQHDVKIIKNIIREIYEIYSVGQAPAAEGESGGPSPITYPVPQEARYTVNERPAKKRKKRE